jgi:hypothetical protein
LVGKAESTKVLSAVAMAYAECWSSAPSADALCHTFDTCKLEGDVTELAVCEYVCKNAQVVDFPSADLLAEAKNICGCAVYQKYRPKWSVTAIKTGTVSEVCLGYDVVAYFFDALVVHPCNAFPYP